MEDKFVYMTEEEIAERKAKVAAIEGLAELRAAKAALFSAGVKYHQAKTLFERGEIDFEDVPIPDHGEVDALIAKYPRAAAYLEAERWIATENPVKVRLGSRAMEKILNGEDPEAVIQEMSQGLDAFYLAQQGD